MIRERCAMWKTHLSLVDGAARMLSDILVLVGRGALNRAPVDCMREGYSGRTVVRYGGDFCCDLGQAFLGNRATVNQSGPQTIQDADVAEDRASWIVVGCQQGRRVSSGVARHRSCRYRTGLLRMR